METAAFDFQHAAVIRSVSQTVHRVLLVSMGFMSLWTVGCGSSPSGLFEAWNPDNDPAHFDPAYQRTFSTLPLAGEAAQKPWSDDYWPSFRGGIAARWRTYEDGFSYTPPTREELKAMSLKERSELSPAEKFDAFRGLYDYPTVTSERWRTAPSLPAWEGLCHGWATASMQHEEPKPLIVRSTEQIDIPFAASDLKALLSYFYGTEFRGSIDFLGQRCNVDIMGGEDPRSSGPACRDLNAGSFHVVLANELGLNKKSFVGDINRDLEVWNQPIYGFESEILADDLSPSVGAAPGTVREVHVKTRMDYVEELSPMWHSQLQQDIDSLGTRIYEYRLELDREGQILGGEWVSFDRPDFFWRESQGDFDGTWVGLKDLLHQSWTQVQYPEDPRIGER